MVFPWNWNSFFRISTFFLSLFRLLFAADPNLMCGMVITFFQFSWQQCFQLFYQVVHHVGHNLVFQHVGGFHPREDDPPGSWQHRVQLDSFFLSREMHAIFCLLS